MEMAEGIAIGGLKTELENDCPFWEDLIEGPTDLSDEEIKDDDLDDVQEAQDNNGGILGTNLNEASNGEDKYWIKAPFHPTSFEMKVTDSRRTDGGAKQSNIIRKVKVVGVPASANNKNIETENFPFTLAAHHLIPGNASLYHEDDQLQKYLKQGEAIKANGKQFTIKFHIGFNVNGAHNGVWLPGNYAIRSKHSPTGVTWGKMEREDWQMNYVAACVKATNGQFHDAHTDYNESVLKLLNKITLELQIHQYFDCDICQNRSDGKDISPPYSIKKRLYNLSTYFRQQLFKKSPNSWRRPWFTSDRWRELIFKNNSDKPCEEFLKAYEDSDCGKIEEMG